MSNFLMSSLKKINKNKVIKISEQEFIKKFNFIFNLDILETESN